MKEKNKNYVLWVQLAWRLAANQRAELSILIKTQVLGKTHLGRDKSCIFLSKSEHGEDLDSSRAGNEDKECKK